MSLKTLKDLRIIMHDECGPHCPPMKHYHNTKETVDIKDLKKLSVGWIKEITKWCLLPEPTLIGGKTFLTAPRKRNTLIINDKEFIFSDVEYIQLKEFLTELIKHGFNIKDEELK